jgi:hypothetical protein
VVVSSLRMRKWLRMVEFIREHETIVKGWILRWR